jgi:hypothetical protein
MKRRFTITFALLLCQLTSAFGQQQPPAAAETGPQKDKQGAQSIQSEPPQSKDKGNVVRISVTLVQVDVTVVDKKGNPVMDLKPEDFEVFQDGRPHLKPSLNPNS